MPTSSQARRFIRTDVSEAGLGLAFTVARPGLTPSETIFDKVYTFVYRPGQSRTVTSIPTVAVVTVVMILSR